MKSAFRATAVLASGSAVTILVGLITAKVWALLVGPAGVGLLGLMLSVVGLGGILASMGIGTALVRAGAGALGERDYHRAAVMQHAAVYATWALAGAAAVVMVVLRDPLGTWVLGESERSATVVLLGIAVALTVIGSVNTSILNAHHLVGALARFAVLNSIAGAVVSLTVLWFFRERGIVFAVLGTAAVSVVASAWLLRRAGVQMTSQKPALHELRAAAGSLFRFGIPFTASSLVGSGVQLALPILVLHLLNTASVGFYRAAMSVSVGYLGFLLTAMAQDYYPRVSAAARDPEKLRELIDQQLRLLTVIGAPIVLMAQALAPVIVPLIYAPSFEPAVPVLQWQMVGNLFKFWSWSMSFVILARSGSLVFFLTESVAGAVALGASWLGVRLFGLTGMGVGFLVTYVVYAAVVWVVVRRDIRISISSANLRLMALAFAGSVAVLVLPFSALPLATIPTAIVVSIVILVNGGSELWKEVPGLRGIIPLFRRGEKVDLDPYQGGGRP